MSRFPQNKGPFDSIIGTYTRSGRQFDIAVVAESNQELDTDDWMTFQVVTPNGFKAEKFQITMNFGPRDMNNGGAFEGCALERLCDLFAELLEPHDRENAGTSCGDDDDDDEDDEDEDEDEEANADDG